MRRLRGLLVAIVALFLLAGTSSVPAQAGSAVQPVSAKSKKKCGKLKGKKKRKCLKKPGNANRPWTGSPYKPGLTCAMSPGMQKKYARYGLTCIDISAGPGFYLTTLIPLKGPVQ